MERSSPGASLPGEEPSRALASLPAEAARARFAFYGFEIELTSTNPALVDEVRRDFSYFGVRSGGGRADVRLDLRVEPPRYEGLPAVPAAIFTPRNVSFKHESNTYIDYFGRALAVFNREAAECVVYGTDHDLLHEIAYLFFLSAAGEHLDGRGIHRLHGLGLSYNGQGILLLLPSGGGKSTITLDLLRNPGFLLLAEDTPLIDRRGRILPFPLRLGIRADQTTDIPREHLRTMQRMEFDPKTLIDLDYFKGRLGGSVDAKLLLVGERNLGEVSAIVPLARHKALKSLVKNMVVGLGVYQGLEFLLERSVGELVGKTGVASSRFYNAARLLAGVSTYRFVMGRSRERNCASLIEFVQARCG